MVMRKNIPGRASCTCKGTGVYDSLVPLGMVGNLLWPKSSVWARAERDESEEASKGQIIKDLARHAEDLGLYPGDCGKSLEKFKPGSAICNLER